MKLSKQQLKQIIKEELGGVLNEMGPEFPGEELPQGPGLETALQDVPPTDEESSRQRIIDELNTEVEDLIASGMDPLTAYGTVMQSPQNQGAIKSSGWVEQ